MQLPRIQSNADVPSGGPAPYLSPEEGTLGLRALARGGAGQAITQAVDVVLEAEQKKKLLRDEAAVMQRYMGAVTDMERLQETLQVPANATRAKELFEENYAKKEPAWFKDLSPEAEAELKKRLFHKTLEYRGHASKIENDALKDEYAETIVNAKTMFTDAASRRLDPDDASETPEYKTYSDIIDRGVAAGFIKQGVGAQNKADALKEGAASRANRVTASDSVPELEYQKELFKKEAAQPGSTYLKHVDPNKRTELLKETNRRLDSLRAEEVRQLREAREETERRHKEVSDMTYRHALQKVAEPDKYGALTRDWVDQAIELDLITGPQQEHLLKAVEKVSGPGNPEVLKRFAIEVYSAKNAAQAAKIHSEVAAAMARGDIPVDADGKSIGSTWLNYLDQNIRDDRKNKGEKEMSASQRTTMVLAQLEEDLKVSGPFEALVPQAQAVKAEAMREVRMNALRGYPEDPSVIYQRSLNDWQSRIGTPMKQRIGEMRRSVGLAPASAKTDDTLESRILNKQKELATAPSDAARDKILGEVKTLRAIYEAEKSLAHFDAMRTQSRGAQQQGGSPSKPQQSQSSTPAVPGPRR